MTFIVNHDRVVYRKNLWVRTGKITPAISRFDPGQSIPLIARHRSAPFIRVLQEVIDLGVEVFGLLVVALLALLGEIGFRLGRRRGGAAPLPDREASSVSTLTAGMLGVMAFTLALTISFAQDRFESQRHATLNEANTIGTAWLRTGLARPSGKPIGALIEEYARGRLAYLVALSPDAAAAALAHTNTLQSEIWQRALPMVEGMPAPLASALISSLNDMFDASLVQRYAMESHAPTETMLMLLIGAMLAVSALGFQTGLAGPRHPVLALLLFLMVSGAMVLIIDLNRPRAGLIRVNPAPLVWTIQGLAPAVPGPVAAAEHSSKEPPSIPHSLDAVKA